MQPKLQRIEIEPMRCGNDDFTVDDTAGRKLLEQPFVKLGKVPIERTEVATLDVDVGLAPEHDRPETVPLGFIEVFAAGGKRLGELRQHRLDGRLDWEHVSRWSAPTLRPLLACVRQARAMSWSFSCRRSPR